MSDLVKETTVILRLPKMSLSLSPARTRQWKTVFVLFRIVTLENDQRWHVLLCQFARRRYSQTRRKWVWTALS